MSSETHQIIDRIVENPESFYKDMIATTSACMNRLLHVPVHYECVRLKRNPAWGILLMSCAAARSRLELVISPDIYVYNALDKWKMIIDKIEKWTDDEFDQLFASDTCTLESIGVLFSPPIVQERRDCAIPSIQPASLNPWNVYQELVLRDKSDMDATMILKMLLSPETRRLCMMQKNVQSQWASAMESVNWWRICSTLQPQPEDPANARADAMRRVNILSKTFVSFIESHSPFIDDTDDHDDYEVRCATVKQNFELNMNSFHRSLETIQDRRLKSLRHLEARERIMEQ